MFLKLNRHFAVLLSRCKLQNQGQRGDKSSILKYNIKVSLSHGVIQHFLPVRLLVLLTREVDKHKHAFQNFLVPELIDIYSFALLICRT